MANYAAVFLPHRNARWVNVDNSSTKDTHMKNWWFSVNHPQMDENFEPRMSLDGCTNSWFLRTYIGTFEHEFWISMTPKRTRRVQPNRAYDNMIELKPSQDWITASANWSCGLNPEKEWSTILSHSISIKEESLGEHPCQRESYRDIDTAKPEKNKPALSSKSSFCFKVSLKNNWKRLFLK